MDTRDYITSERFIHDDLLQKAERAVNKLHEIWKKEGKIDASLLTWPSEPILDDNGQKMEGVCCLTLPDTSAEKIKAIRAMVRRTKAYALLLIETVDTNVQALLETPHGTRCWTLPIYRSGDTKILGEATVTDNREHVGLLWSPHRAVA